MAKHYENFPVASLLLPRRLRAPVAAIYAFARQADDIADEGDDTPPERLAKLCGYADELRRIEAGLPPRTELFVRLAGVVRDFHLPLQPFHDLLDAFAQDVEKTRYADYGELADYCRRSANPVGRLMLHLYDAHTPAHAAWADAVCTSLQLINFLQDVAVDWRKGRVYLPQDELRAAGLSDDAVARGGTDAAWRGFMRGQAARARGLMLEGAPIGRALTGRIGLEMRMIVEGGLAILDKIDAVGGDVFNRRPTLRPADWAAMFARACRGRRAARPCQKKDTH